MESPPPRPYVVAWRLSGQRVVVVGAGSIGEAKIETLLPTGADLWAFDPTPSPRVRDLADRGIITLRERKVQPLDVRKAMLVVDATGESHINGDIAHWARSAGALVNCVDDPANCDITIPSVIERGPATIAVTTNGATPAGARFMREQLQTLVPPATAKVLDHASRARHALRASGAYRYDYGAWRDDYFTPAWDDAVHGDGVNIEGIEHDFVDGFVGSRETQRTGSITLVGAGPGGGDLITVKGARALARADVVLYDRLADPTLLELAPRVALRIPVGKAKGTGVTQAEINDMLVEHAAAGMHVVRLKGGDPFVFGRGCEEADAAIDAGIPVEIIPGLSSALAAPALAGISLTDRRLSSGFTVVSGHRAADDDYCWESLVTCSLTLVVLMAASTAGAVAARLLNAGMSPETPVAFIHGAGRSEESVARLELGAVEAQGCPFPSPTTMVIGSVAAEATPQLD